MFVLLEDLITVELKRVSVDVFVKLRTRRLCQDYCIEFQVFFFCVTLLIAIGEVSEVYI